MVHLQENGFRIREAHGYDLTPVKERLGVPKPLYACHTAEVEGYIVEGHVPARLIRRLLDERPEGALGLAVPGMPLGSPGMEVAGVPADAYDVYLLGRDGSWEVYERVRGG